MGYAVVEAPSVLGLFPGGVELLPTALLEAGLATALDARHAGRVIPPPYDPERDPDSGLLNPSALRDYAIALANATEKVLDEGDIPLVLGGDCSILLGTMLALHRRGRYGLLFIDGHADYYQPEAEPNGEAASMDLALVTGRGPDIVTNLEGRRPLVREQDVVHLARRDAAEAEAAGSQRIEDSAINVVDLTALRRQGAAHTVTDAIDRLTRSDLDGFWVHLDCDAIDDDIMPAVDYRLPGGLSWQELETVLRTAGHSRGFAGLEVTILNPRLDPDGSGTAALVGHLTNALLA
jgi:arginase